jgi:hypothetical protein
VGIRDREHQDRQLADLASGIKPATTNDDRGDVELGERTAVAGDVAVRAHQDRNVGATQRPRATVRAGTTEGRASVEQQSQVLGHASGFTAATSTGVLAGIAAQQRDGREPGLLGMILAHRLEPIDVLDPVDGEALGVVADQQPREQLVAKLDQLGPRAP